ncbi:hypothetical protein V866_008598 [Kwoniella sp. B9012]
MSDNKSTKLSSSTASSCEDRWKPQLQLDDGSVVDLDYIDDGLRSALRSRKQEGPITLNELATLSASMLNSIFHENGDKMESDGIFVIKVPAESSEDGQSK